MSTTKTNQAVADEPKKLVLLFTKAEAQERVNNWWHLWMSGSDSITLEASLELTSTELVQYLAGDFSYKQD